MTVLPEEVRKEIAISRRLTAALSIPIEHAERIALLAYRSGIEAGVRAGLEAADEICKEMGAFGVAQRIRSLPVQEIVEKVMKEGK